MRPSTSDPSLVDGQVGPRLTVRSRHRVRNRPEQEALVKRMRTITDESVVYEAALAPDEKPATLRQQLLRAAKLADVEIAVKRSPAGFYFGLMTPERRSNRGRKKAA